MACMFPIFILSTARNCMPNSAVDFDYLTPTIMSVARSAMGRRVLPLNCFFLVLYNILAVGGLSTISRNPPQLTKKFIVCSFTSSSNLGVLFFSISMLSPQFIYMRRCCIWWNMNLLVFLGALDLAIAPTLLLNDASIF